METAETNRLRELLEAERSDLRKQLEDLGADPDEDSIENLEFDHGFADSAQSTAERAKVLAVVEGLRERLADVDHAMKRLERGDYGTCDRCGKQIGAERLAALPATRLCVDCKKAST